MHVQTQNREEVSITIEFRTEELTSNRSDNVFNNLYREGHRRDIRLMVKKGDQPQTQKIPDAPKLVQDFL